ncbi:MAG: hypothetical protein IPK59_00045 [Rhodospirillaceae bacterium]|nr:hypothetical protein [Rhodospirillaceae bacterium]
MVNGVQAVGSVGGVTPVYARVSAAADLSVESAEAAGTAEAVAAQPADKVVAAVGQSLRYNSFEFSYRQDFGKIVLLRQKPDTGEVVQQFPSEYYLRKYADSERVARTAQGTAAQANAARPQVKSVDTASKSVSTEASAAPSPAPVSAAAPVEAAPAIAAAPALPGGAASASPVNLTI